MLSVIIDLVNSISLKIKNVILSFKNSYLKNLNIELSFLNNNGMFSCDENVYFTDSVNERI